MVRYCLACIFLFATLSTVGCAADEELLGGLQVQEAIEIVVALKNAGIPAQMKKSGSSRSERYGITLGRSDRTQALRVLNELHLPRPAEESFTSLTAGEGFVPNLRETANLRLDRALGVEIERALSAFEGVVEAKAIVRSHLVPSDKPEESGQRPTASVVLRYVSRSGNQPFTNDEIKRTVAKAVPGLVPEDVSISSTRVFVPGGDAAGAVGMDSKNNVIPLAPVAPFPFLVPASDKDRVRAIVSLLLGGFALVGLLIGWTLASFTRKPKPQQKVVRTAVLEASFKGPGNPPQGQLPGKGQGALPPKGQ